jgi:hypothetical protein
MEQGSVVLPVIGYHSRQETEALMNEYAERGPKTFLYVYYCSIHFFS